MKVATIEKIIDVIPHPNADKMSIAKVNGWQVCIKKDEYKPGDLCIFVAVDSVLEDKPPYEFLRNKNFRIRTCRLRGELSCGIAFPLSLLKEFGYDMTIYDDAFIGFDVSDLIYAKHYEKPLSPQLAGCAKGNFPSFLKKTDSERIQSYPKMLEEFGDKTVYFSLKYDGTSFSTYTNKNDIGVCSRNLDLKEDESNVYWKMFHRYKFKEIFNRINKNICVQSEIYGNSIQNNPLKINDIQIAVFDVYDIDTKKYYNYSELKNFCEKYNLPMVDILYEGTLQTFTIEKLVEYSDSLKYPTGNPAEGFVCRPILEQYSNIIKGRMAFKVISNNYME